VLTITAADLEAIVDRCRRELPREACGMLGGREGRVESVHPVKNTSPEASRYAMDPAGQFRALEAIHGAGRELVGIYHSHPVGPALPSSLDRDAACWPGTSLPSYPGAVHVIVSLRESAAPAAKGYALVSGAFVEVPIVLAPRPADAQTVV
jgi:proteasome lid subunit RPN8/RPN11